MEQNTTTTTVNEGEEQQQSPQILIRGPHEQVYQEFQPGQRQRQTIIIADRETLASVSRTDPTDPLHVENHNFDLTDDN